MQSRITAATWEQWYDNNEYHRPRLVRHEFNHHNRKCHDPSKWFGNRGGHDVTTDYSWAGAANEVNRYLGTSDEVM